MTDACHGGGVFDESLSGECGSMKWSEVSFQSTREAVEPIANIFHEFGTSGVVIEDSQNVVKNHDTFPGETYDVNRPDVSDSVAVIKAYLPTDRFLRKHVATIKDAVHRLSDYGIDLGNLKLTVRDIEEEDWASAWKTYYKPVKASESITIIPTWETYEPEENEIIVELDPGMAFGTGTHPTTKMCLEAVEKVIKPGDTVIDVGTGSGVLSIAAAKLGASAVTAFDLDDLAVKSATMNVALNKMEAVVTVRQNDLLDGVDETVDVVIGNLLADIISRFPADAARVVKNGGSFIASGITESESAAVVALLEEHGFAIEDILQGGQWVALIAKNGR